MDNHIHERIFIDSNIHFGKPCIKNTRIPVYAVLELIKEGISFDDIIKDYYPDITKEDIQACVEYATYLVKEEEIHFAH